MVTPRASTGLLRNHIKLTPRAIGASPRYISATPVSRVKDELGGPGGQKPPPTKPGGPEAIRRNWFAIGGGALLLAAAYSYLTAPKETKEAVERRAVELEKKAESKAGISGLAPIKEDAVEVGRNVAAQTKEQAAKTMKDLSGRGETDQRSFRHE